jgi:small-conductance mechanosensitive channel
MRNDWTRKTLIVVLSIFMLLSTGLSRAVAKGEPEKTKTEGTILERVAGMSDEEARKLLITTMQEQSSTAKNVVANDAPGSESVFGTLLQALGGQSESSENELAKLAGHIPLFFPDLYRVFAQFCPSGTHQGAIINVLWVLVFIGLGLTAEKIVTRFLKKKFLHLSPGNLANMPPLDGNLPISEKFTACLITVLPSIIGLFVFFIVSYFSYFTFISGDLPFLKLLFLAVLLAITLIRIFAILAEIVLAPSFSQFRILPLSGAAAATAHRVLVWTSGYIVTVMLSAIVIRRIGAQIETVALFQLFAVTVLLAVTAVAAVLYRTEVAAYILAPSPEEKGRPSFGKQSFASIWHFLTLLYLAIFWYVAAKAVVAQSTTSSTRGAFLISFFILPIWMLADQVVQWLVKYTMLNLKLYEKSPTSLPNAEGDNESEQAKGTELFAKVKFYARFVLIIAIGLWVASLWGYTLPFVSKMSGVIFNALLIMVVALLFWQFISSWIERKIKDSVPVPEEGKEKPDEEDDEWGTTVASRGRAYTLLPIIRSFVASILVVMVVLMILSSMGVDIGPLLAGAGVVGLAVGFGAQKVVSDIFSGIFYLLDDAFRVGEYLTAGAISGTVESISLRNVMLRHHRGMLQIMPHSKMGTITNYMRGGIIEKFSLDFAYDADIDKVRKIIKKVGLEMLDDPELGPGFLRPIKSQGVSSITNSVMTIRVKFTAKPGTQFVIRREAFKRITAALQAKGIQYAHKKVIVDLPEHIVNQMDPAQVQKIAQSAGAAAREIMDEEEKLKQQLAQQKPRE